MIDAVAALGIVGGWFALCWFVGTTFGRHGLLPEDQRQDVEPLDFFGALSIGDTPKR